MEEKAQIIIFNCAPQTLMQYLGK